LPSVAQVTVTGRTAAANSPASSWRDVTCATPARSLTCLRSTFATAYAPPKALKLFKPKRPRSSLYQTSPSCSACASPSSFTSGVGAYPGQLEISSSASSNPAWFRTFARIAP
jgi:hypothetical protein